MDVSNLFWNFIDYELHSTDMISEQEEKLYERIRQGDLIMNIHHLNETEPVEFLYYETLRELISMACYICTGEKLKKIQKYVDRYFDDIELAEMFQIEM